MNQIDRFITGIAGAQTIGQVIEALRIEIDRFGFEWFSYKLTVPPTGSYGEFFRSGYPRSWTDRYVEKRYVRDDTVLSYAHRTIRPFLWEEVAHHPHLTKPQRAIFDEAAEIGLKAGATVPIHGPGHIKSILSVANNVRDESFAGLFAACRHELQLVATYAHERLLALGADGPSPSLSLSPRELEVLTWTALGNTAAEISEKLTISAHTVKDYIDNAKVKLGVRDKTHAAAIAISEGLIRI